MAGLSRRSKHLIHACFVAAILLSSVTTTPARPANAQHSCVDGSQDSGAVYRICMPAAGTWNGDLVVYAHGYVQSDAPIAIPEDQLTLPDGTTIPELINGLGFAFAMSSYSVNGLAVKEGLSDSADVVGIFSAQQGEPEHVYLVGVSEGGLVTALGAERRPDSFDGGLATCGPVGDFQRQINYWGDTRVVFDYFFPGVIPGSAVAIPQEVITGWDAVYKPAAAAAMLGDPAKTAQLLIVARVPFDPSNPASGVDAVLQVLWYNVFATNDGITKLGGQPFDNSRRVYKGSASDALLNATVARFTADATAVAAIRSNYQTSGQLTMPTVTLHTIGDPVVPYWHEPAYRQKIIINGVSSLHTNIPSPNFGHCEFDTPEVLAGFALLVFRVSGQPLQNLEQVLLDQQDLMHYRNLTDSYGLSR